jgi:hypothetical protein
MTQRFAVGDLVRPKPEWSDTPNNAPSGRVRGIATWGKDGALYVGDERRAFAAYVFEREDPDILGRFR